MASDRVWTAFSLVAGLGSAALTRSLLDRSWRAAAGKNPPENPADPDVSFAEAVLWSCLTGAMVALARMLAQRRAAHYYHRTTGHLPPGLGPGDET